MDHVWNMQGSCMDHAWTVRLNAKIKQHSHVAGPCICQHWCFFKELVCFQTRQVTDKLREDEAEYADKLAVSLFPF